MPVKSGRRSTSVRLVPQYDAQLGVYFIVNIPKHLNAEITQWVKEYKEGSIKVQANGDLYIWNAGDLTDYFIHLARMHADDKKFVFKLKKTP
jgi:hypothetical protein